MMKGEVKKLLVLWTDNHPFTLTTIHLRLQPSIYADNHPFTPTTIQLLCSLFSFLFLFSRSYNENAISLLEQNQDKIDWDNLSSNVAAIILINYLL